MYTALYVGAGHAHGDPLGLLDLPHARRDADGAVRVAVEGLQRTKNSELRLLAVSDAEAASNYLCSHIVDVLLLDARTATVRDALGTPAIARDDVETPAQSPFAETRMGRVLQRLFPAQQTALTLPRQRILAIVGEDAEGVLAAYELGRLHIDAVVLQPSREDLLARIVALLRRREQGKVALCLAGGGIDGCLYELGVLRAFEAFFVDHSVVDFDLFCGISAGSFLGAFLANGVGPEEIAKGLHQGTARIDAITRADLFDPNWRELSPRLLRLTREMTRLQRRQGQDIPSLSHLFPAGFFAGNKFRDYVKRQLQRPGMTDRFAELRRPLFIGATDQDTAEAVVFSADSEQEVPIHQAVRASSALVPFYTPEKIGDRYYIDGAFARTTNMRVAVQQGATLVVLIDPLVPVVSEEPGFVYGHGGVFGAMQGLKSLIYGRFNKAVMALREMYPDVSFHLFRPLGEDTLRMAGSPMKFFYQRHLVNIGYQSGLQQIRASFVDIARDFALHGIEMRDPERESGSARSASAAFEPERLGLEPWRL